MSGAPARATVFLDRDGTLNVDHGYVHTPDAFTLLPGVPAALRRLGDAGYRLIVVTNQSGVARGLFTEDDVRALHAHLDRLLEPHGVRIAAYYYCPCHPDHGPPRYRRASADRKPGTGMFERACRDHAVDVARSYMVGDSASDMLFAARAGLRPILVETGRTRDVAATLTDPELTVVPDLGAAAEHILARRQPT